MKCFLCFLQGPSWDWRRHRVPTASCRHPDCLPWQLRTSEHLHRTTRICWSSYRRKTGSCGHCSEKTELPKASYHRNWTFLRSKRCSNKGRLWEQRLLSVTRNDDARCTWYYQQITIRWRQQWILSDARDGIEGIRRVQSIAVRREQPTRVFNHHCVKTIVTDSSI